MEHQKVFRIFSPRDLAATQPSPDGRRRAGCIVHQIDSGVQWAPERPALGAGRVTPNAEYVLSDSEDNGVYAWRAEGGKLAKNLKGHSSAVGMVLLVGPKYAVMASARTNTALWMDAGLEPRGSRQWVLIRLWCLFVARCTALRLRLSSSLVVSSQRT